MKGFWEKTKQTFAVGAARVDEFVSNKKIEDNPEFIDKETKLEEMQQDFNHLNQYIKEMNTIIQRTSTVFAQINFDFGKVLSKSGPSTEETVAKANEIGTNVQTYGKNAYKYYIPTHVLNPLKDALNEIDTLQQIRNEAKKDYVLLTREEEKLTKAQEKGSPTISQLEQSTQEYREQHDRTFKGFINGVTNLYERKADICTEVYTAAMTYIGEFFQMSQDQMNANLPQYSYQSNNNKYPSITVTPPVDIPDQPPL